MARRSKKVDQTPVEILGLTLQRQNAKDAKQIELLDHHFRAAVRTTRDIVRSDRLRSMVYAKGASPFAGPSAASEVSGVSLFDDCALPKVSDFADFIDTFSQAELDQQSLPFVGLQETTARPVWNPTVPTVRRWKEAYFGQLFHLSRLNWSDRIWQKPNTKQWATNFGPGVRGYMTELFGGRFVDRNGTSVKFDLGIDFSDLTKIAEIQVSPQVAGSIVSTLIEFLGDQAFQVPFYSPAILQANRDFRAAVKARRDCRGFLATLAGSIEGGNLSSGDASDLKIPDSGPIDWALTGPSPLVKSDLARMILGRASELDEALLAAGRDELASGKLLDQVDHGTSELQAGYTCHKCGVITRHLVCHFVPDPNAAQQGVCGRDRDTGLKEGKTMDYADLIGKFVAYGATTAEKSVRSLMGGIIRGVSLLSLDNEVIAEVVSAAVSTLAKKVVEKVVYEWMTGYIDDDSEDPDTKREFLARLSAIHDRLVPDAG